MIIEYLPTRNGMSNWSQIRFACDDCGDVFLRRKQHHDVMKNNPLCDKDYCKKCWQILRNKQPDYREKMSRSLKAMRIKNPDLAKSISATSKKRKINAGSKNAMKRTEVRAKMSRSRNIMLSDPNVRQKIAGKTKKAWEDGKFDGVAVGRCKWYSYVDRFGKEHKVQGTWELAFIKWLDGNKMPFQCHRGWIPYTIQGIDKNYYPDFWVDEWDSYADVKADYFYDEAKMNAIQSCNPQTKFRILKKQDLLDLGVKI